jgi:general secretion pathway protein L
MHDVLRWWVSRLAELVPESLRRLGGSVDDALIITPIASTAGDIGSVAVSRRRGNRESQLGRFALDPNAMAAVPRDRSEPVALRLGPRDVLTKTVSLPLAAERDLGQVLGFEMDRETPFTADELFWNYRVEARDRYRGVLSARLVLIPRVRLASLLAALHAAGLFPRRAEIALAGADRCEVPLDDGVTRHSPSSRWLVKTMVGACALLAVAAVALPFVQQQLALDALDTEIATHQAAVAETTELNRELARLSGSLDAVAKQRAEAGRPLTVLAAATRVLPDDTYLTELTLRQRQITLTGRSPAAARLIGTLAADRGFRNPAFAAPVTRIEALRTEVFTITAEVLP